MIRPSNIIKADPIETERGPDWRDRAHCLGHEVTMDLAVDHPKDKAATDAAKAICRPCPSKDACLAWALHPDTRQRHGVWGGLDADERRSLLRKMARAS